MGKEEDIVYVLDAFLDSRLRNVHTMIPGKIEKYYGHATRKARVKPLVKLRTVKGDILTIPPIDDVPVIFPGSAKCQFLFPLKRGDGVEIRFSEEGIGAFLKGTVEVTADSFARFAMTDAVCTPGLWSFKNVPTTTFRNATNNTGLKISGTNKLEINNSLYYLGDLITELIDLIINLTTIGPPGVHQVLPAQQILLLATKLKFQALLE